MAYWLMKSEPDAYGWDDLVRDNGTEWDGVRNNAAAINLRKMAVGDRAFFYHSLTDKAAVGVMAISRTAKKSGPEGNWVSVEVKPAVPRARPGTLAGVRATPERKDMEQHSPSRRSVTPEP